MGIIVNNRQYYTDFDEYIRQGEPSQREKASIWQTAIGLQAVDGLLTSDYLKATACKHIEGEIDIDEAYLMKGDEKTESEYLTKLVAGGIMTINEARNRLGLNKVDGGDEIILAYSKIEDNKITDNEDNTEEDDGERI